MGERENQIRTWLFNPFIYIAGFKSLLIGIAMMAISAWVGFLNNSHFDGVLDMHRAMAAQFHIFLLEVVIDWVSISLVLFVLGVILSKSKIRLVDVFGTQALARWPMIPAVILMVFIPDVKDMDLSDIQSMNGLIVPAMVMLLFIIWFIALMFNAYKISCNLEGAKLKASFIGGLILAEILSKILIAQIVFGMLILPDKDQLFELPPEQKGNNIEIAKGILSSLNDGKYGQASIAFDDNMKKAFPVRKMSTFWSGTKMQYGEFEKNMEPTTSNNKGNETIFILCHFEKGKLNMKTVFNDKHEVIGLFFIPDLTEPPNPGLSKNLLRKYHGVYLGTSFPLKITISDNGSRLIGQATGQPPFPLDLHKGADKFIFEPADLKLEFFPDENKMILRQADEIHELKREP